MANVFDRLQALQGKSRVEIVAGSAHAEWEKTGLFVSNTGREGTGNLVEIVLAQCGVSAQDKAAPLLKSAMALKETNVATSTSRLAPPILPRKAKSELFSACFKLHHFANCIYHRLEENEAKRSSLLPFGGDQI